MAFGPRVTVPSTHTFSQCLTHIHTHSLLAAWGETCCNLGGREQRASLMQLARAFDVEPRHSLLSLSYKTLLRIRKKNLKAAIYLKLCR